MTDKLQDYPFLFPKTPNKCFQLTRHGVGYEEKSSGAQLKRRTLDQTGELGSAMSGGRARSRVWLAFALVLVVGVVLGTWLVRSPSTPASPSGLRLIPAGEYQGVFPLETPRENIGPKTRFLFVLERPGPDQLTQDDAWYGYPTDDAVYLVNGEQVSRQQFEDSMPPLRLNIVVEAPGKMTRMDASVPEGGWD